MCTPLVSIATVYNALHLSTAVHISFSLARQFDACHPSLASRANVIGV